MVLARSPIDLPVEAGEHARRGVDVLLGVVADAEAEQLHDLAAEVFLRPRARVQLAVEPVDHRGIFRHRQQHRREAAGRELAQLLDLSRLAAGRGSFGSLSIMRVARSWPTAPAILL